MNDVADAERSEWRWMRKRIDVLDAKRREYCCGGVSYALGNAAYKVACVRGDLKGDQEWEVDQVTRVFIENKRSRCL